MGPIESANPAAGMDKTFVIPTDDLKARVERRDPQLVLVDVLGRDSYNATHIPGAINIPYVTMSEPVVRAALTDPAADIIVYCGGGT